MSWVSIQSIESEIFYWKPKAGHVEVDFVLRSSSAVLGVEVKSTDSVTFKDTKSMREFLKTHPEAKQGIIVYTGNKILQVATGIYALFHGVFFRKCPKNAYKVTVLGKDLNLSPYELQFSPEINYH